MVLNESESEVINARYRESEATLCLVRFHCIHCGPSEAQSLGAVKSMMHRSRRFPMVSANGLHGAAGLEWNSLERDRCEQIRRQGLQLLDPAHRVGETVDTQLGNVGAPSISTITECLTEKELRGIPRRFRSCTTARGRRLSNN